MVVRIEIEIFNVEQAASAGLAADQIEKLGVGQFRVRPFEQISDVLQEEWNGDPRLYRADFSDDRLGQRLRLRHRQEVGEVATGCAREGKVLAVGGSFQRFDDGGNRVQIGEVERH